jgi:hypothetical protein
MCKHREIEVKEQKETRIEPHLLLMPSCFIGTKNLNDAHKIIK